MESLRGTCQSRCASTIRQPVQSLLKLVFGSCWKVLRQRKARAAAAQRVYGVGSDTLRKVSRDGSLAGKGSDFRFLIASATWLHFLDYSSRLTARDPASR